MRFTSSSNCGPVQAARSIDINRKTQTVSPAFQIASRRWRLSVIDELIATLLPVPGDAIYSNICLRWGSAPSPLGRPKPEGVVCSRRWRKPSAVVRYDTP